MQLGYYEFANHGDLFLLGAIGLFLVARNWWDIIRYGLSRHAAPTAWLTEPAGTMAATGGGRARVAHAVRRLRRRGKILHQSLRHRHA
ncbi:MAG: hypothetical protein ACT4PK_09420 [Gammaproteobacteria bacterium]